MSQQSEIVKNAEIRIGELQAAERKLNREINSVKDKEWNTPLNDEDRKALTELRAAKASVLAAIEELSFVTMEALDKTDELKRINNAIVGVMKDLKVVANRIARIGEIAQQITKVLGGIETLGQKVAKFTSKK